MNLYMKLVEVRRRTDKFSKDAQAYGYKYVTGNQVLDKIKPVMDELNLLLVSSVVPGTFKYEDVRNVEPDKYGKDKLKKDVFVTAEMKMTWINAENPEERLEIPYMLCGQQDDISQSFGSGLTYSERYFLMKFFNIATDNDDPDNINTKKKLDSKNSEVQDGQPKTPSVPTNTAGINEAQIKRLYAIAGKKGRKSDKVNESVKSHYKVESLTQLTKKQYDDIVKKYEEMEDAKIE